MAAYLMILAVQAAEIAGGKEDRSGPAYSGKGRFFAVVRHGLADDYFRGETAEALFSAEAICTALPRTENAWAHHAFQGFQCLEHPSVVYFHFVFVSFQEFTGALLHP
jgi:hypothetical protein